MSVVDPEDALAEPAPKTPVEAPRLAAVVFTDVVGYSARMQRDEVGTISAVHAEFKRMREQCERHGGEVLNTMGDGMMLCFGSAVAAVQFALQMQEEFGLRNASLPPGQGLTHRVGIHIGDIYRVEGGQIAGDGVNIAARLESRAPKGGICISQLVYDTVKSKVAMRAESMGAQTFKNIAQPLSIWRISPEGSGKVTDGTVRVLEVKPKSGKWLVRAVLVVIALIAAETLWPYREMLIPKDQAGLLNVIPDTIQKLKSWALSP